MPASSHAASDGIGGIQAASDLGAGEDGAEGALSAQLFGQFFLNFFQRQAGGFD
jgi:hypothetical protein